MRKTKKIKYNVLLVSLMDFRKETQSTKNYLNSVGYSAEYILTEENPKSKENILGYDEIEYSSNIFNKGYLKDEFNLIQRSNALIILNYDLGLKKAYVSDEIRFCLKLGYILDKRLFVLNNLDINGVKSKKSSLIKPIYLRGDIYNIENYLY